MKKKLQLHANHNNDSFNQINSFFSNPKIMFCILNASILKLENSSDKEKTRVLNGLENYVNKIITNKR